MNQDKEVRVEPEELERAMRGEFRDLVRETAEALNKARDGAIIADSEEIVRLAMALIARGILPDIGIPLVIQDKTFLDPSTVLSTDPTWLFQLDTSLSNLWMPHVYMPNQNPNAVDGANPVGRWDYGPFFWPPWPVTNQPLTNPTGLTIANGGSGYTSAPLVTITPAPGDTTGSGATATATIDPGTGAVIAITLLTPGTGYTADPIITIDQTVITGSF